MLILHITAAFIVILSHSIFIITAVLWSAGKIDNPGKIGSAAKAVSQISLPLVYLTGILALIQYTVSENPVIQYHILVGIVPLLMIFVFQLKKSWKKQAPWLLPVVNLLVFVAAAVIAFL
ncbi:MAG: hypothetical protein ACLFR1_03685 [Spirochaetia bacterium]